MPIMHICCAAPVRGRENEQTNLESGSRGVRDTEALVGRVQRRRMRRLVPLPPRPLDEVSHPPSGAALWHVVDVVVVVVVPKRLHDSLTHSTLSELSLTSFSLLEVRERAQQQTVGATRSEGRKEGRTESTSAID